jgi:hypothetical protein
MGCALIVIARLPFSLEAFLLRLPIALVAKKSRKAECLPIASYPYAQHSKDVFL